MRYSQFPISTKQASKWLRTWSTTLLFSSVLATPLSAQTSSTLQTSESIVNNTASYSYTDGETRDRVGGSTNGVQNPIGPSLTDPRGQILSCGGKRLDDYTGFFVGLYEPNPSDPTGTELGRLVALTRTEVPDQPDNTIPLGISPNTTNRNPYQLSNSEEGRYSFLLDPKRGQLAVGRTYLLVVNPPAGSIYTQRRIKIQITAVTPQGNRSLVSYRATSLDGLPITAGKNTQFEDSVATVGDADRVSLQLLGINFKSFLCQVNQIQISKSGDRANAAPGDTVVYRLTIRNISDGTLDTLSISDILPVGFRFLPNSVKAELNGQVIPITANANGRNIRFNTNTALPREGAIIVAYAAQLTPDALRGDGRNLANVNALRTDNDLEVRDGPAIYRIRVNPGILSDCGNILGRVFVDKNFDGEQQPGEPGVANAVVWMDDGNRITTDENGLFHVTCVLPGARTGALDLTTLPGYTLAPNLRFIERNSPSRLVRLSPGGTVRMNFGVTPTAEKESK